MSHDLLYDVTLFKNSERNVKRYVKRRERKRKRDRDRERERNLTFINCISLARMLAKS